MELASSTAVRVWIEARRRTDLSELKSLAYLGLVQAVLRWDTYCEEHGYEDSPSYFAAFATRRMRGAIFDAQRSADWAKRSVREKARSIADAGPQATEAQQAAHTGLSVQDVRDTKARLMQEPISMDCDSFASRRTLLQVSHDADSFSRSVMLGLAKSFLALDPLPRTVIAMHYYLGLQLQEVASQLGISESRASHLHTDALLQLFQVLRRYASVEHK